jgi:hypothetical protein
MHTKLIAVVAAMCVVASGNGQEVTRADGGSIRTKLSHGIVVNENSSLRREWVAIHQDLPLKFQGTPGVTTIYESGTRYSSGDYKYTSKTTLIADPSQAVTAFEVRFVTLDVFGDRMNTLSASEVQDINPGASATFDWSWRAYRENDVSEYFASIAFISKVRTEDGQVHSADYAAILEVVRRFAKAATEADLDPPSSKPQ